MVLMVVIDTILTGLVMSLSWAAGVQTQVTSRMVKVDQAYYAAEAGVQRAAWYIKNGKTATQPLTGTINSASYSVTWAASTGNAYLVTSVGTYGTAQQTLSVTVTPPIYGAQAAVSVAKDIDIKNLHIIGNAIVGDDAKFSPGNGDINGSLTYGGSLSGNPSSGTSGSDVTGTITKQTFTSINWSKIDTTLKAAAAQTLTGPLNSPTIDFTAVSGTNKVIYVNGNVTNPTIVGSGTLYVNGTVKFNDDVGTSANPVNVVATGDITTANNSTFYGGLYTEGDWHRGKIDLTGTVYVENVMEQSNNGQSYIRFTGTPWFDTRIGTSSSLGSLITATQFTAFGGPKP